MSLLPERIEALDIGCGDGRSTLAIASRLGLSGDVVGIDKHAARLPAEREANISFAAYDAMDLPNKKLAQIATLLNVLPGLQGATQVQSMLRKAAILARDFVYVAQPQFDSSAYLIRRGFKTNYSDQSANRYQGTSADYFRMARTLLDEELIADFALMESERIRDSSDPVIHALQSAPESGPYDDTMHRYKQAGVSFSEPIYRRLHIVLCRKPAQLVPIVKRLRAAERVDSVIYSTIPL
jgi:SAM-dependent methyltransferase